MEQEKCNKDTYTTTVAAVIILFSITRRVNLAMSARGLLSHLVSQLLSRMKLTACLCR